MSTRTLYKMGPRWRVAVVLAVVALAAALLGALQPLRAGAQESATPMATAAPVSGEDDGEAAAVAAVGAALGGAMAATFGGEPTTLAVVGEAEQRLAPDIATVTLGVQTTGKTAGAAITANSEAMASVLAAVKDIGIADEQVRTTRISLRPVYAPRPRPQPDATPTVPTIIGYEATNTVAVRIKDIESIGDVLDTGLEAGANQIGGISFALENQLEPYLDALDEATRLARRKADVLAAAAGLWVVGIAQITEESSGGPSPIGRGGGGGIAFAESAISVPVQSGEVAVRARVRIEFLVASPLLAPGGDGAVPEAKPTPTPLKRLALVGPEWTLISYGSGAAPQAVLADSTVTAQFSAEGLTGAAGCNRYFGAYDSKDKTLTIGPLGSTRMACSAPEGLMEQETTFLAALQAAQSYAIDGDRLLITYGSENEVLTFAAR